MGHPEMPAGIRGKHGADGPDSEPDYLAFFREFQDAGGIVTLTEYFNLDPTQRAALIESKNEMRLAELRIQFQTLHEPDKIAAILISLIADKEERDKAMAANLLEKARGS